MIPVYSRYWSAEPRGVKIARITQRKPRHPEPGCLLIRIMIEVPSSAYVPAEHTLPLTVADGDGELIPALAVVPDGQ